MANNEPTEKAPSSPPNWLFGLDKLTGPTMEYFGIAIRDTLKSYLNAKRRERAALKAQEKEFYIRQAGLLDYGADQFALSMPILREAALEKSLNRFEDFVARIATAQLVDPKRAIDLVSAGLRREDVDLSDPAELGLYHLAGGIMDMLTTDYSTRLNFHLCFCPSVAHRQTPDVSDDDLDGLLNNPETIDKIGSELSIPLVGVINRIMGFTALSFGIEWTPEPEDETKGDRSP